MSKQKGRENAIQVVNTWANSWRRNETEKDVLTIRPGTTYLVRLLAVLVFRLTLEPVCPVHFLCLVISAIDEHACGIQPYTQFLLRILSGGREQSLLTLEREGDQYHLYRP